ncbi:MAG TPA: hypothetical protein VFJ05_03820 [Nitrososphaeraceae archaeon]|nr:hypothetical protein [Nitrososphaeraceae archaeon]
MSINDIIPPPWQFVTNVGVAIRIIAAIVTATYKITRAYGKLEEKINLIEDQLNRIEGHPLFEWYKTWQKKGSYSLFR